MNHTQSIIGLHVLMLCYVANISNTILIVSQALTLTNLLLHVNIRQIKDVLSLGFA